VAPVKGLALALAKVGGWQLGWPGGSLLVWSGVFEPRLVLHRTAGWWASRQEAHLPAEVKALALVAVLAVKACFRTMEQP
jgi:hypothetical protein